MIPGKEITEERYIIIKLPKMPKHESVFNGVVGAGILSLGLKICSLNPASWGYAGMIAAILILKKITGGIKDADNGRGDKRNDNKPVQNVL
jgi:hypothetical protein